MHGTLRILFLLLGFAAGAGATPVPRDGQEIDARLLRAVKSGLRYLASTQSADGSWKAGVGFKLNEDYKVTSTAAEQEKNGGGHVGVTALSLIAFLAGGYFPGRGPYGDVLERGLNYILSVVKEDGYITDNGSRMYSHAFATLFLTEVYGMTHRSDVREKLQMAVDLIVKSQNKLGSWRYEPMALDSDMSITVCQVQSLRSARNIGIKVPKSTIERAIQYVKESAIHEGPDAGAFKYQAKHVTRASFPLTAAGVTALFNAGAYGEEDAERGLKYLLQKREEMYKYYGDHYFYYYGHYYAVQAMFIQGEPYWSLYFPAVKEELLQGQRDDGSWENATGPGPVFATAVATIILQIPYRYLPIFQR